MLGLSTVTRRALWTAAAVCGATLGCSSPVELGSGGPSSDSPRGTTTGEMLPATDGSTTTGSSSMGTGPGPSSGDSTTGGQLISGGFITDPDGGGRNIECSTIEQDCPRGEKCNAWADDGGSVWNAARCFPIAEDPDGIDEPCSVDGNGLSGVDSCDLGSICLDVNPQRLEGSCTPYCTGSNNAPVCDDPDRLCRINANGVLALCLPPCDPLDQQTCPEGAGCYPIDNTFTCAPDASGRAGGAPFDGCEFINACDPGLFCVNPDLSSMCPPDAGGCCLPVCDTSAPECPAAMVCEPWFEPGNPESGDENVGVCGQDSQ